MCLSPLLKSTLLATKHVSPPTVFDLGGWNGDHFVGNWVAETDQSIFFNIRSLSSKNMQHIKICKKCDILKKIIHLLLKCILFRNLKNALRSCAPSHGKWNKIIKFILSVKLWEEIGFLQDPQKAYIFYAISFLFVSQKKSWNKPCL